jgi:RNA polymerase sigma factor (sigma-70 family)
MVAPQKFSKRTNERLNDYVALSYALAGKFRDSALPNDELQQIALLGIARGLESYKEGRASETSWCYFKGYNAIRDALRTERRRRARTARLGWDETFDLTAATYDGQGVDDEDDDDPELDAQKRLLRKALRSLDPRVRTIVRRVGMNKEKQQVVADALGITQSWCSRLYARGLAQIRAYMDPNQENNG